MIKRLITLLEQDVKVAFRYCFHYVVIILALLMVLLINFVIPDKVKLTPIEIFFDNSEGKVLETYLVENGVEEDRIFQYKEDLINEVEKNSNAIGIIMEGNLDNAKFTIINQGTEGEELLNVLDATIEETLSIIRGNSQKSNHSVEYLRPKSSPIPFNMSMVPIIIVTEAVMLGFLLIAVMVFQEKEEGSIKAYRVSPAKTLEYIISKSITNIILALIYSFIVILLTKGFEVNYLRILLIVSLGSFLMTLIGLTISVFFQNLQEFLFIGVLILAIMALPMVSYLTPSFSPGFITWLPSYSILFSLRETLFYTGKSSFITSIIWILLGESIVFLALSYLSVQKNLMKEGK